MVGSTDCFLANGAYFIFTAERVWRKLTPSGIPPAPRFGSMSVVHKNKMVVFGGYGMAEIL